MSLHPAEAHWFEAYIPRERTVYALEAMARTGRVELDRDIVPDPVVDTCELREQLRAFERVRGRYEHELPEPPAEAVAVLERPEAALREANATLRRWCAKALRLRRRRRRLERERDNLCLLEECARAMGDGAPTLAGFGHAGDLLFKEVLACPREEAEPSRAEGLGLVELFSGPRHVFHLVADLPEHRPVLERDAVLRGCRRVAIPEGLPDTPHALVKELATRRLGCETRLGALEADWLTHREEQAIRKALRVAEVLGWYLDQAVTLTANRRYCHVTGWTSEPTAEALRQPLQAAGIDAIILFHPPPPGRRPSVHRPDSRIARPFRLFVDMLGTPGVNEVDPTPWLALIVPLLFGYMFPDVGHGLLLAAGGWLVSRRVPALRLLVPCGLAAAAFGLPFGEVFGLAGVVEPLWWHPLEQPLLTLFVPMLFGFAVVLLGMTFSAVEARWRGEFGTWLATDGLLTLAYVLLVASLWRMAFLWAALAAAAGFVMGAALVSPGTSGAGRFGAALGALVERLMQLALNTLSFLRVGAFALAHAALSHALFEIAALIEAPVAQAVALVIGHLLVIVLEALVVFVQTTRLVLFEFFIRFLQAEGRAFRPLVLPGRGSSRY